MLTMAATALSGMWKKPGKGRAQFSSSSTSQSGDEFWLQGMDPENNVTQQYVQGRLPALRGVVESRRSRRRGGEFEDRGWQEKTMDHEFDFVIVPSDGCCMSGSESDDSDYSVGWFEPHSANFTDNEDEEKFQVLVPSYRSTAIQLSPRGTTNSSNNSTKSDSSKDSSTPPWASLLSNLTHYTNSDMQKQLELWLQSLTSNN
ncbi:hypothetical protein R1sor_010387 [Riccia sorocarpa]|uniref:Uncharacterized protein n=1 Tax=Riccia sorocarpa TaxID=122646 RepID=A0ABD3I1Z4_9MARC